MKNILLLLFISYFIISCSSNTKTPFEEEAYKMLKTEISDTFSGVGNDVDILNTSTEYYTDSLCVIKLSVKGKNELGGKTSNVFEYIYLKEDDSSTMGFLREIQKNDSSLMKVADIESEDSNGIINHLMKSYTIYVEFMLLPMLTLNSLKKNTN